MTLRSVLLSILSLLALIFLILNWQGIMAPVSVNLIVKEIQAPLGLILLFILGGLWLVGIAWALMQQASTLVEIRKAYKEANVNKSLADHAEMSRLEQTKETLRQEMAKNQEALLAGLREAVQAPTTSAQDVQKRLEAVEKALEKLTLRVEQIADKAQIGPAPELPEPEPKKTSLFGFLGGKSHKEQTPAEPLPLKPAEAAAPEPVAPAAPVVEPVNSEGTAETPAPESAPESGAAEPGKPGFFKKMFH